MILSDGTIRKLLVEGRIAIDPLEETHVQPASVDVRLDDTFLTFRRHLTSDIDPWKVNDDLMERVTVADGQPFILHPGEFVLGTTLERLTLPDDIVARIEGKSSLGRLGLLIHATAGFRSGHGRGSSLLRSMDRLAFHSGTNFPPRALSSATSTEMGTTK